MRSLFAFLLLLPVSIFAQTVCIDAGHPSEVGRGTAGKKITEVRAAWKVAQFLKTELEKSGIKVVLTKTSENQFVKNRDRAGIANKAKADLMVRLHCDSQSGQGFAIYVPMKAGKIGSKTGPSSLVIADSKAAGKVFHQTFAVQLKGKLKDNGLMGDVRTAVGAKHGALVGSIFSEVPVVLVEMCRLSNAKDEAFIAATEGQKSIAAGLAKATLASLKVLASRTVSR